MKDINELSEDEVGNLGRQLGSGGVSIKLL